MLLYPNSNRISARSQALAGLWKGPDGKAGEEEEEEVKSEDVIPIITEETATLSAWLASNRNCERCASLLELVRKLELELREARAESVVNDGVQRRLAAMLVESKAGSTTSLSLRAEAESEAAGNGAHSSAGGSSEAVGASLSLVLAEVKHHKATSPEPHSTRKREEEGDEPTSTTPLMIDSGKGGYGSADADSASSVEVVPSVGAPPKKSWLCCCG
jgi:hypothetical protein